MLDACTRCGKCVEACPSVEPAGISDAKSEDVIGGILELLRSGSGPEASRKWAQACTLSGQCIKACDYGVNPRFLLTMARLGMAKSGHELAERRRHGVEKYRDTSRGVAVLSRLQLDTDVLERLGQGPASASAPVEAPDFVFYTGCNVLKTPHIALLALDIMDALGISYQVMGGPSHCCGIRAAQVRRCRDVRPHGFEYHGQAVAQQLGAGHLMVPELLRPVYRNRSAGSGAAARLPSVRDQSVHAFSRRAAGAAQAAPSAQGSNAGRAAQASRRGPASSKPPPRS